MKKLFWLCFIILAFTIVNAYSQQKSKIELNDGSMIEGEVSSLADGTYTINSNSLGQVRIDASKVRRIDTLGADSQQPLNPSEASNVPSKEQIESIKTQILSNPDTLKNVTELSKDPQFQELLNDPAILSAAKKGNIQELISNEKIKSFSENAKIKQIKDKMEQ